MQLSVRMEEEEPNLEAARHWQWLTRCQWYDGSRAHVTRNIFHVAADRAATSARILVPCGLFGYP